VSSSRSGASILAPPGVSALIWATGYRCDFSWIDLPVLDACGEPVHRGGITAVPGLYFLGLQWLSKMNSSLLSGVGDDAERLADNIAQNKGRGGWSMRARADAPARVRYSAA
jgi:putative flavoprotein involved in K+ transport